MISLRFDDAGWRRHDEMKVSRHASKARHRSAARSFRHGL